MPAQNVTTAPFMAHPVARQAKQRTEHIMAAILLENFMHMALNVCALGNPSEPEITHQARIGWRRVQSSLKFFKPLLSDFDPAPMAPLKPLIQATDQLIGVKGTDPSAAFNASRGNSHSETHDVPVGAYRPVHNLLSKSAKTG